MRVVFVGNFGLRTKGTMIARALPLAQALARRGHDTSLVVPPWDSPADSGRRIVADGVPIWHTRAYSGLPECLAPVRHALLTIDLCWLAWTRRPEVLYVCKPKAYAGLALAAFRAFRWLGLYQGSIVLDTDDWEGDGGWNDRERERFSPLGRRFIAWHEQWCLRAADSVTYASRALAPLIALAGARQATYLPIGVPPAPDGSPGEGEPAITAAEAGQRVRERHDLIGRSVILAYTRLAEFAPNRLVEVFARIVAVRPDVRLLVVGRGLHGEEIALAAEVERRGLADRVVLAGWVEPTDLAGYLASADLALHLLDDTLLNRTKGLAKLLELLAAGVPVVVDAVGQALEVISDKRTGRLVPTVNAAAMAQAALDLLDNPAEARMMGLAAARDVRARFGWDEIAVIAEKVLLDAEQARVGRTAS